uniref:Splicing factor n=1 Tax=Solanum tuberosum TaxID=4113 RepID=M1BEW1_SOLTU
MVLYQPVLGSYVTRTLQKCRRCVLDPSKYIAFGGSGTHLAFAQLEHAKASQSLNCKLEIVGRTIKVSSVAEDVRVQDAGAKTTDFDDDDGGGLLVGGGENEGVLVGEGEEDESNKFVFGWI